jgi:hypothetical protein
MSLFLTRDEKRQLSILNRLSQSVDGREERVRREYANWETINFLYRTTGSEFSDDEAERLAEAGAEWFGMYVCKPSDRQVGNPDRFISAIIDIAEEDTCLSLPVILEVFEIALKERKTLPSIAEMCDRLSDRHFEVRTFANAIHEAIQVFFRANDQLAETYNAALERIRFILQDFPDYKQIQQAWMSVIGEPFGVDDTPAKMQSFVDHLCVGLKNVDPWPVIPLFNLYLLSQIPEQKRIAAVDFVIARRQSEGIISDEIYSPPELWQEALKADLNEGETFGGYEWVENEIHEVSKLKTNDFFAAAFGK